jgi:glycosyltransferase involved in cell wall biosynthesis
MFGNLLKKFKEYQVIRYPFIQFIKGQPKITCVITSYNQIELLKAATASVLNQTLPVNEILVCDDASSDGSQEYIAGLEAKFTHVRGIYQTTNLGPAENRHRGILEASSPFITQVDGDDRLHPNKLEKEWRALNYSENHVAFSNIVRTDETGEQTELNTKYYGKGRSKAEKLRAMLLRNRPIPRDMLFSKSLYLKSGGYQSRIPMYEDWSLKLRLLHLAAGWRHSGTVGTYYNRIVPGLSGRTESHHSYWKLYCISHNFGWLRDELKPNDILQALLVALSAADREDDLQRDLQAALTLLPQADLLNFLTDLTSTIVGMQTDALDVSKAHHEITERVMLTARHARASAGPRAASHTTSTAPGARAR